MCATDSNQDGNFSNCINWRNEPLITRTELKFLLDATVIFALVGAHHGFR